MTTSLNQSLPARDTGFQNVGVLRRSFTFSDFPGVTTRVVGALPANAQVVGGGVVVTTAVVGGTLNVGWLDFDGTTLNAAGYASALVVTALTGLTALDDLAAAAAGVRSVATQVTVTSSAQLTAGAFDVIILFVTKNPASGAAA
jgi:hypothetical protein